MARNAGRQVRDGVSLLQQHRVGGTHLLTVDTSRALDEQRSLHEVHCGFALIKGNADLVQLQDTVGSVEAESACAACASPLSPRLPCRLLPAPSSQHHGLAPDSSPPAVLGRTALALPGACCLSVVLGGSLCCPPLPATSELGIWKRETPSVQTTDSRAARQPPSVGAQCSASANRTGEGGLAGGPAPRGRALRGSEEKRQNVGVSMLRAKNSGNTSK